MRTIPVNIAGKVANRIQTTANNCAVSTNLWIARPTTALTNRIFLERQTIMPVSATSVSIAIGHRRVGIKNDAIYVAYISDGVAHIIASEPNTKMSNHLWDDTGFSEDASTIAIAYDGTMPKSTSGGVEFVTELNPWVFWANEGVLYARKLYSEDEAVVLAEQNCTKVSAIRAMWSEVGAFDFGLVVFFILSGSIYYRQLIQGVWTDAELVTFGPTGIIWTDIAVGRTWDYRVALQAKASNGNAYELFTQFMGIGKQTTEHLTVNAAMNGSLQTITYGTYHEPDEHLNVSAEITSGTFTWGLPSVPVSIRNIDDGYGNKGVYVEVTVDHDITSVDGNTDRFTMVDSEGINYVCLDCEQISPLVFKLEFQDFNIAEGRTLTVGYTPGTIMSPAVPMVAWTFDFVPAGVHSPDVDAPVVVEVTNL